MSRLEIKTTASSTRIASRYLTALTLPPRKLSVFVGLIKKKILSLDKLFQSVIKFNSKFNKEFKDSNGYDANPLEEFRLYTDEDEYDHTTWDDIFYDIKRAASGFYGDNDVLKEAVKTMESVLGFAMSSESGRERLKWIEHLESAIKQVAKTLDPANSHSLKETINSDWKTAINNYLKEKDYYTDNGIPFPTKQDMEPFLELVTELRTASKDLYASAARIEEIRTQAFGAYRETDYMPKVEKVETLYHASVNAVVLGRTGFSKKVPETLGIGGAQGDKRNLPAISMTSDLWVANNVARALKEAFMIAKGKLKFHQLQDWAKREGILDKVLKTFRSVEGKLDPQNILHVFNFYRFYLAHSKRYDPLFFNVGKSILNKWRGMNEKNIGVIAAKVNMDDPNIKFLVSMQEYRVPPEAILSIEKVIR